MIFVVMSDISATRELKAEGVNHLYASGRASGGDFQEGAWAGASFHADWHCQPGVHVWEPMTMEEG